MLFLHFLHRDSSHEWTTRQPNLPWDISVVGTRGFASQSLANYCQVSPIVIREWIKPWWGGWVKAIPVLLLLQMQARKKEGKMLLLSDELCVSHKSWLWVGSGSNTNRLAFPMQGSVAALPILQKTALGGCSHLCLEFLLIICVRNALCMQCLNSLCVDT